MIATSSQRRLRAVLLASTCALVLAACLAACSGSAAPATGTGAGSSGVDAAARAELPGAIRSAGVINVGTESDFPPFVSVVGGKEQGFDIDLMAAVAARLGVKINYEVTGFENLVPGVQGGRYEMAISDFYDTTAREQLVDLVDYYREGLVLLTKPGNPDHLTINTLCGKTVAAPGGGIPTEVDLPARSKTCTDAGKPAVIVQSYTEDANAVLALLNGRADALEDSSTLALFTVKRTNGQLAAASGVFSPYNVGMVVPKKSSLGKALQTVLNAMIANGSYKAILKEWNLTEGAIPAATINVSTVS
jgi:polar amino acid transport system substrate-binding protein